MGSEKQSVLPAILTSAQDERLEALMRDVTSSFGRNGFRKIRVFISSKCGDTDESGNPGRFDGMRREIANRLKSSPVFDPYLWEDGGASTASAKNNYISELNDSDICVFIIDNKVGVTPGVQNEINQVFQSDMRALFYFVSEYSTVSTPLQKQLSGPKGYTYKVVNKMSEVPERVVEDLQRDVLLLYRRWCNHDVEEKRREPVAIDVSDNAMIPSSALASLSGVRGIFGQLLFNEPPRDPVEGLDNEVSKFAKALYITHTAGSFDPCGLVKEASRILPEKYSRLIEQRWQAIHLYFCGLKCEAIDELEKALEFARHSSVESWILDDLLIDLRNIQIEYDMNNPQRWKYQESLNESGREIVYPIVDRAVSDALKGLESNRIKKGIENYSSYTIGENVLHFFDPLCKAFAAAACFGSLTHLSQIAVRMRDIVYFLCTTNKGANLNAALLMLTIAIGRPGDAQGVLQAFSAIRFDSDPGSAKRVFDFCAGYSCLNRGSYALFEAFGELSCYFSEADCALATARFIKRAEDEIASIDAHPGCPKAIFGAMHRSSDRLSLDWMIGYVSRSLALDSSLWVGDSLRFLAGCNCHFDQLGDASFSGLLEALSSIADSSNSVIDSSLICDALQNIGLSVEGTRRERIDAVAKELTDKEYDRYQACIALDSGDDAVVEMIENAVDRIRELNKTQGVSGHFVFGTSDTLRASRLLSTMKQPPLQAGIALYGACLGTLASPTYDIRGKIDACEALCSLINQFSFAELGYVSQTVDVIENRSGQAEEIGLGKETPLLLNIWMCCLALLAGQIEDAGNHLRRLLAFCYQTDEYNQARAGDALKYLVGSQADEKVSDSVLGVAFAYACYLATARHFQLNLRGFKLLRLFLAHDSYRNSAAMIMCDAYYGQSPRVKKEIVDSIKLIAAFDEGLAALLRDKVMHDSTTTVVAYLKRCEEEAAK
mgnify:CR=1 FL=1